MATPQVFETRNLIGRQPPKNLELLDVIDKLRAQGLNKHVDLPQLIVCNGSVTNPRSLDGDVVLKHSTAF
jgi:hypothetical protein